MNQCSVYNLRRMIHSMECNIVNARRHGGTFESEDGPRSDMDGIRSRRSLQSTTLGASFISFRLVNDSLLLGRVDNRVRKVIANASSHQWSTPNDVTQCEMSEEIYFNPVFSLPKLHDAQR